MKKFLVLLLFIVIFYMNCAYQAEDNYNTKQQTCNNNLASFLFLSTNTALTEYSDILLITGVVRYISCRNEAINKKDDYIIPI